MELLWLTQPRRTTCLATVTRVQGPQFQVDRALFAPRSLACRHPQQADQGTVWCDGEKRRLGSVQHRAGQVWYALRGTVPEVGATLQCQLDQDIRAANDRAHTAMHLLIEALQRAGAPPMTADPEVKGGGHLRITLGHPPGAALAAALVQAKHWVAADLPVVRTFRVHPSEVSLQHFLPPTQVPDGVPFVAIGAVCTYACDGTHVDRTGRIASMAVSHARQGRDGFVVGVRVV